MRVAVVLVWLLIIVKGEVKSTQRWTIGNRAILSLLFRISGKAPDLRLGGPSGISTEVVISDVSEAMIMRLCV